MFDYHPSITIAAAMIGLAACDEGPVPEETAKRVPTKVEVALGNDEWLPVGDERDPGTWLAAREARRDGDASQLSIDTMQYAVLLQRLGRHYHESGRMIANRIAQLQAEVPDVSIETLMQDFAWQAGNGRRQTLGEVAQHYLVLRRDGQNHDAAVGALREAYGAGTK